MNNGKGENSLLEPRTACAAMMALNEYKRECRESKANGKSVLATFEEWLSEKIKKPSEQSVYYHYEVRNGFEMSGRACTVDEAIANVQRWVNDIGNCNSNLRSIVIERNDVYAERMKISALCRSL